MALSEAVRQLTGDLRQAHLGRMGSVTMLRGDTARYRADVRGDLRDMAGTLTRGFGDADATRRAAESARRAEMARAARRRDAQLDRVRASVASMRSSVASTRAATASMLKALRDDVQEAHEAWSEFGAFARTTRAAAPVGTPADAGVSLFATVLRLLGDHPTGMRLGELQKALELPRRQVARLMDELVAARRARLDKLGIYFKRQ
ncbi:MAG: helix-turn-helix domain-containing protein [Chloroflexi bacterium]|nr:helix-turn-helix domain-containing protein [Chloroflexota bacterium]